MLKHTFYIFLISIFSLILLSCSSKEEENKEISSIEILEEEKNAKVIMIVGSDTFSDIQDWYKYKELLTLVDFIVMNRPNFPLPINKDAYNLVNKNLVLEDFLKETSKKGVFEIKVTPLSISSSLIRRDVLRGKELKHLINPEVEKYLKKHKLYESKSSV